MKQRGLRSGVNWQGALNEKKRDKPTGVKQGLSIPILSFAVRSGLTDRLTHTHTHTHTHINFLLNVFLTVSVRV